MTVMLFHLTALCRMENIMENIHPLAWRFGPVAYYFIVTGVAVTSGDDDHGGPWR
jgi:hypothetical protein